MCKEHKEYIYSIMRKAHKNMDAKEFGLTVDLVLKTLYPNFKNRIYFYSFLNFYYIKDRYYVHSYIPLEINSNIMYNCLEENTIYTYKVKEFKFIEEDSPVYLIELINKEYKEMTELESRDFFFEVINELVDKSDKFFHYCLNVSKVSVSKQLGLLLNEFKPRTYQEKIDLILNHSEIS